MGLTPIGRCRIVTPVDAKIADFVTKRITMNAQSLCRAGEIAAMTLQAGNDELLFKLLAGLAEGHSTPGQFPDDL